MFGSKYSKLHLPIFQYISNILCFLPMFATIWILSCHILTFAALPTWKKSTYRQNGSICPCTSVLFGFLRIRMQLTKTSWKKQKHGNIKNSNYTINITPRIQRISQTDNSRERFFLQMQTYIILPFYCSPRRNTENIFVLLSSPHSMPSG